MFIAILKLVLWLDGNDKLLYKKNLINKIKTHTKKLNISVDGLDANFETDIMTLGLVKLGRNKEVLKNQIKSYIENIAKLTYCRIEEDYLNIVYYDKEK